MLAPFVTPTAWGTDMNELLIRGACLADGSGNPTRPADVAVKDGRIAEIGRVAEPAAETIDADGLVLAPGVVDVHTHYDAQLTWDSTASPSPSLGVTTVVMGNCGFGIAPAPPAQRDAIARNLSEVEGMSLTALETGIDWSFESFSDYLNLLRRKGSHPNVGVFVGHSTVRSVVMGDEASVREATSDEVADMRRLVLDAVQAGAIGFASSQSLSHRGYGGVPMPSRLANEDEMRSLVGALGEARRGIFQMTAGPGTTVPFLESLAVDTGRPIIFSGLLHNEQFPERCPAMLDDCVAAQQRGNRVHAQVSCQPLSMDFTLANAYPLQSLEVWADLRGADADSVARAITDPSFRDAFRRQLATPTKGKLFYGDWHRVEVAQAATPAYRAAEGAQLDQLAAAEGADPVDLFFDMALAEDLGTVFSAKLLNADEDAVEPLLRHEASVISMSDAGAHLMFMCDAGYALHLFGHWVRERQAFSLAEAVRQVTSLPADIYGITGRGRIEVGAHADLLLFDADTVAVSKPRRVWDLPGGDSRLVRDAIGVHGVWVNGIRVADADGRRDVGAAPGRILDRFEN